MTSWVVVAKDHEGTDLPSWSQLYLVRLHLSEPSESRLIATDSTRMVTPINFPSCDVRELLRGFGTCEDKIVSAEVADQPISRRSEVVDDRLGEGIPRAGIGLGLDAHFVPFGSDLDRFGS
jgi:hypothetical protein